MCLEIYKLLMFFWDGRGIDYQGVFWGVVFGDKIQVFREGNSHILLGEHLRNIGRGTVITAHLFSFEVIV